MLPETHHILVLLQRSLQGRMLLLRPLQCIRCLARARFPRRCRCAARHRSGGLQKQVCVLWQRLQQLLQRNCMRCVLSRSWVLRHVEQIARNCPVGQNHALGEVYRHDMYT